jgi:ABC-type lipoprotein export system ATPase subunit
MLELRQISKAYRGGNGSPLTVLCDVDLQVEAGTFVSISGPSGSGKSTLLLIAGSLLRPDVGQVLLDGQNLTAMAGDQQAGERAKSIGFVFQRFHLLPYLTVRENIVAATVAHARSEHGAESRADELMQRLDIAHRAGHVPGRLSVGEMQRTALARALYNRPKVILADEPMGNLDPDNAELALQCFSEFAAAGGAVLMVTHSPEGAARTDVTWWLRDGKLAQS